MNHADATTTTSKSIGISFDMTTTQALELAEGIAFTASVLRDDIGTTHDLPKETSRLLYGSLCLITHAARALTDFVEMTEKVAAMSKLTDTAQGPFALENALMEILEYAALLDDLTTRSVSSGMDFTTDGLCGLNRLASHMRGLAVEALGNLPNARGGARP